LFVVAFISVATYFFGFVAVDVKTNFVENPTATRHKVICILFWCLTNGLLMATACKDPGIMTGPTSLPPNVASDPNLYEQWRYCEKCGIYQGPKTRHCNDCKACIAELDHLCPWMSKCVGKGNMRAFKWFNVSWIVFFIYAIVALFNE
jgi:hypothetical protein